MNDDEFRSAFDNALAGARVKLAARRAERAKLAGFSELATEEESPADWLWHGYLARGGVTVLTSLWKAGKTTLLSVLLTKLHTGGQLAGLDVHPSRAAVVSEERSRHWRRRMQCLDFGDQARIVCRPFADLPTQADWQMLIGELRESAANLAVIDTFAGLAPAGAESNAASMLKVLRPLEQLTGRGMSVLILHHPSKRELRAGMAARGTGALSAYADVLIEMQCLGRSGPQDRRRRLSACSRYDETPRELVVELSADGRDYIACAEALDDDLQRGIEQVCEVLRLHGTQLTRESIVKTWPDQRRPNGITIWRWLDRAVSLVDQAGAGLRGDPYRYWLHGQNVPYQPDLDEQLAQFEHEAMRRFGIGGA